MCACMWCWRCRLVNESKGGESHENQSTLVFAIKTQTGDSCASRRSTPPNRRRDRCHPCYLQGNVDTVLQRSFEGARAATDVVTMVRLIAVLASVSVLFALGCGESCHDAGESMTTGPSWSSLLRGQRRN
jgi:hypothetical protein